MDERPAQCDPVLRSQTSERSGPSQAKRDRTRLATLLSFGPDAAAVLGLAVSGFLWSVFLGCGRRFVQA